VKVRRKLLTIGHSYVVGVNRRLADEMAIAGASTWDVTVVAPTYFHGSNDLRPVHLAPRRAEPVDLVGVPAYFTRVVHGFVYGPELASLLGRDWSLVHCWEEPYILAGGQVAWWTPKRSPLVFRTAQNLNKRYPPPFSWIERYAIGKAAGWICCGNTVVNILKQRAGYSMLPMAQIPLGVDVEACRPDRALGDSTLEKLGWDRVGAPVVGYLGRLSPEKGIDLLMATLDSIDAPWRALFVGAGVLEGKLRSWASRHGDRVRVCSGVKHDEVPQYLSAMDVMCAPSQTMPNWREQFGRMLIEAFAAGVPVIASDSGEIPFIVRGVGVVVGEKDTAGWRAALADLLESPGRRAEMSACGIEAAAERYAWPVVARQYLEFFERLAP